MRDELLKLLKQYAYKKGEFKLSSGRTSEHYINCKPVTLSAIGLKIASTMILEKIPKDTRAVGGLTLGADPLVSGVSLASYDLPWTADVDALIVRKQPKGHGTGAWIEGPVLAEGSKVVVLEDVITTGGSAIKAATRLRDAGYNVDLVVAIVDRQVDSEATDFMDSSDLNLISLYKLQEVVNASYE